MAAGAAMGGFLALTASDPSGKAWGAGVALCGLTFNVTLHVKANKNTRRAIRYLRLNDNI